MNPLIIAALAPVLRDVNATMDVPLDVRDEPWSNDVGGHTAMVYVEDGSGQGVAAWDHDSMAANIAAVADRVQEIVVEELWSRGRSAVWPSCPEHPNSHPLSSVVEHDTPLWICPATRRRVQEVGHLDPS